MPARLRTTGPLIVRASTAPADLPVPDLDPRTAPIADVVEWLRTAWERDDVRDAVATASPVLADRLETLMVDGLEPREARRTARSLALYLLRWQRRCTPFGSFAGVTTAVTGRPASTALPAARPIARPDAGWLRQTAARLARNPSAVPLLVVTANPLAVERNGRYVLQTRLTDDEPVDQQRETSIRATPLVRTAMEAAREPASLDDLADRLAQVTGADMMGRARLSNLLLSLVQEGYLTSSATPSSTSGSGLDPLHALAAAMRDTARDALARARDAVVQDAALPAPVPLHRRQLFQSMCAVGPAADVVLAIDTRFEGPLTVPAAVVHEAERAASLLLRLASEPFGAVRWLDYHARFRARFGAGALVPVKDLVSDAGLGYPTGFLGAPRTRPAWRQVTDRDAVVLNLLHRAALDGSTEVVLSAEDIAALTVGDREAAVAPARCEIGFAIHTASPQALDRGDFLLRVTAAPEATTSMTGRFAHLLDPADRANLAGYFAAPGAAPDQPVVAQLMFRPRRENADNVVRVPVLAEHVIVLDEHYDGPATRISLHDLAVTADDAQMYLVQTSTGRRVVPVIPHALELTTRTPPLARFIAEVAEARSAVYRPFDLGTARTLDHTPRLRHGRTILAPARWVLHRDAINGPGPWWDRFDAWRSRHRVPSRIVLADGGTHLPLDLEQTLDRHLLEHLVTDTDHVELHEEVPGSIGWLGRPAEVLAPMTPAGPADRRPPATTSAAVNHGILDEGIFTVRLAGSPARFDQIAVDHIPRLALATRAQRWWFTRLRDLILPERDQYLQITLDLGDRDRAAGAMTAVARFVEDLAAVGLPGEVSVHPHHPRVGVFGDGPAAASAYDVFAADSRASLEQIRLAHDSGAPAQGLAAASLVAIAVGLVGDTADGCRLVLDAVGHEPAQLDRATVETACTLADPADGYKQLRAACGDTVADAWEARGATLAAYRTLAGNDVPPDGVLWALWRDHHARVLGVDAETERATRLMARRAAQRLLALGTR